MYNEGLALALSSGLDISDTSRFIGSMTNDDSQYMKSTVKSFNNETTDSISKIVTAGIAAGLTADEIKKQLSGFKIDQAYRVNRFASNEAWRVSELAGLRAMAQLDGELNRTQTVGTYKTWVIQSGACPNCVQYAGVSIKINEKFLGGIDLPPAHVLCRCKIEWTFIKSDDSSASISNELHCSKCDRFLGITNNNKATDKIKCSNSKCRALETPVVKPQISAST